MTDHDQSNGAPAPASGFRKSRLWIVLIVVLAMTAILLGLGSSNPDFSGNGLIAVVLLGSMIVCLFTRNRQTRAPEVNNRARYQSVQVLYRRA